jgi:hypothetical protein
MTGFTGSATMDPENKNFTASRLQQIRASKRVIVYYINKFSACQVFKDPGDFEELIGVGRKGLKYFGNPIGTGRLVMY